MQRTFFKITNFELRLHFTHAELTIVHQAVLKIEAYNISANEATKEKNRLKNHLAFFPLISL